MSDKPQDRALYQALDQALDQPTAVRSGEELDIDAIDTWLKQRLDGLQGRAEVAQFPSGASNLTYLLRYPDRDLVLRRPPHGRKAKSAHDMGREYRVMAALRPVYPYVPRMLAFCDDPEVLGDEFYVMERLEGIIPRQDLPDDLGLDASGVRRMCRNVVDKLIELHRVDWQGTDLEQLGKGAGYVERQVHGWTDRYARARTENVGDFSTVTDWLKEHMPADRDTRVIHNDFRLDNVVLDADDPERVIGVLDWEMATLGDPLMDLGNSLAYWVQADDDKVFQQMRRQPSNAPGMMTRTEIIEYYGEQTGYDVSDFDYYLVYGLFRLAVIVQQIYYRYHHGQTADERFADWHRITNYLEQRCNSLIE